MNRTPVTSSNIKSVGYEDGTLEVEFSSGSAYAYRGPRAEEHYRELIAAASPGGYFARHVRNDPSLMARKL